MAPRYPDGHSEFDGGGVMPNTVHPKGNDALTASDKLRLQSITGQEEDSRAPVDPYFWQGNVAPNDAAAKLDRAAREANERRVYREEANRYRETRDSPY